MITGHFISRRVGRTGVLFRTVQVAALVSAAASLGVAGCASAAPYNPQHLSAGQLGRIEAICRNTMGLNDWEAPSGVWGAAQDPNLDPGENHYQGCVASLSQAQQGANLTNATVRGDAHCRAEGYAEGSPGLAECVLRAQDAPVQPVDLPMSDVPARPVSSDRVGSFYTASPGTISRRERVACAQLGLNPAYAAFDNCVAQMDDTFDRIDNPHY